MTTKTAPSGANKDAARRLMERQFERLAMRWHDAADRQLETLREWEDNADLWRMAGFGEPPEFRSLRPGVRLEQVAS